MEQGQEADPVDNQAHLETSPITPKSQDKRGLSPHSTPSTGKSKYTRKFNTKWLGKPSPQPEDSSDSSTRPPPQSNDLKLPDSAYPDDVGDSYSSTLRYPPTRPDEDPAFSPSSTPSRRGSRNSPRYGGEARHIVPAGIVPSPPTSASLSATRSRSRPAPPSEPTIDEYQNAEYSSSDNKASSTDASYGDTVNTNVEDPIEVDENDTKAAKRAKNTLAARKSRQKKRDVEEGLRVELQAMTALLGSDLPDSEAGNAGKKTKSPWYRRSHRRTRLNDR